MQQQSVSDSVVRRVDCSSSVDLLMRAGGPTVNDTCSVNARTPVIALCADVVHRCHNPP